MHDRPGAWIFNVNKLQCSYGTYTIEHQRCPNISDKQTEWFEANTYQVPQTARDEPTSDLKHLRHYGCYGNQSVIGNRGGRSTFRNLRKQAGKLPIRRSRPKHHTETMGRKRRSPLQKKRKHTQWVRAAIYRGSSLLQETPIITWPKAKVVILADVYRLSGRSTDSLGWVACCQYGLTTDQP